MHWPTDSPSGHWRASHHNSLRAPSSSPSDPRLLRSLSRRLAYLPASEQALSITEDWVSHEGLLSDVSSYDRLQVDMLRNIAALHPAAVLDLLEIWLSRITEESYRNVPTPGGHPKNYWLLGLPRISLWPVHDAASSVT